MAKLSIIIPCYNEINTIKSIISEINQVNIGGIEKEIIVVDDFSKDGTRELLKKINNIKLTLNSKNLGKTESIINGLKLATGDYIIIQDADLEYDPLDYNSLIRPFIFGRADIVYGSRMIGSKPKHFPYKINLIGNYVMTFFSDVLSGLFISDIHTCYIMMKIDIAKNIIKQLQTKKFGFNPEVAAIIGNNRKHLTIYEVGISYYGRTKEQGKKISFKDGIDAMVDIFRCNILNKYEKL